MTWPQTSERAKTSAPCASSTSTTAGWCCATAHMSAVWPRAPRASASAPCVNSNSTTSGAPERAATISGVSPARSAAFGFAPASISVLTSAAAAVLAGGPERCHPEIVRRVHVGAGVQQQPNSLDVVPVARPVQGGGAVPLGHVDACPLVEQRPDRRRVAVAGRVDKGRGFSSARDTGVGEADGQEGARESRAGCHAHRLWSTSWTRLHQRPWRRPFRPARQG